MVETQTRRLLMIILGALLIRFARRLHVGSTSAMATAALGLASLVVGVGLIGGALVRQEWTVEESTTIATLAVGLLAGVAAALALIGTGSTTDGAAFGHYAGDLLLQGKNPYAADMKPAMTRYPRDPAGPTKTVDGGMIRRFSYPPGAVLWFVPAALISSVVAGGTGLWLALALLAICILLIEELPNELSLAVPIITLAPRNLWIASVGGIIDAIWILPILGAMAAWRRRRWRLVGGMLGLAAVSKQQSWIIIPLALVILLRTNARGLRQAVPPMAGVGAAITLPFLIWKPVATTKGILLPFRLWGPPMVQDGIGVVRISASTGIHIPHSVFQPLMYVAAAALAATVWIFPRRFQAAIWIAPSVVLLFSYRSLANYFFWAPLLAVAALGLQEAKQ